MPGEVLGGVLSSAIPVVGAGISAALERSWAKKDLADQRAYNSPANQLRLLDEAGLPAAAYFSSGVGAQSDQPRATNVDPTLGTAEGVNNYFQNRFQRQQIALLDQEVRSKKAQADVDTLIAKHATKASSTVDTTGAPVSIAEEREQYKDQSMKDAQMIKGIELEVMEMVRNERAITGMDLATKQVEKLAADIAMQKLNIENADAIRKFQRDFVEAWEAGNLGKMLGSIIGQAIMSKSSH